MKIYPYAGCIQHDESNEQTDKRTNKENDTSKRRKDWQIGRLTSRHSTSSTAVWFTRYSRNTAKLAQEYDNGNKGARKIFRKIKKRTRRRAHKLRAKRDKSNRIERKVNQTKEIIRNIRRMNVVVIRRDAVVANDAGAQKGAFTEQKQRIYHHHCDVSFAIRPHSGSNDRGNYMVKDDGGGGGGGGGDGKGGGRGGGNDEDEDEDGGRG